MVRIEENSPEDTDTEYFLKLYCSYQTTSFSAIAPPRIPEEIFGAFHKANTESRAAFYSRQHDKSVEYEIELSRRTYPFVDDATSQQ